MKAIEFGLTTEIGTFLSKNFGFANPAEFTRLTSLEFLWIDYLPFKKKEFLFKLEKICRFVEVKRDSCEARENIAKSVIDKNYKHAIKSIEAIEKEYPFRSKLLLEKALIFIKLKNYKAALDEINRIDKDETINWLMSSAIDSAQKKIPFEDQVHAKRAEIEFLNLLYWGKRYQTSGKFKLALKTLDSASDRELAELEENKSKIRLGKRFCSFALGLESTLELNPKDYLTMLYYINEDIYEYVHSGLQSTIDEIYRKILKNIEDCDMEAKVYFNLGVACKKKGFYREAQAYLVKAEHAPNDFEEKLELNLKEVRIAIAKIA